jgi:pimeloyl-ACP methyl ester carboxylesterase
MRYARRLFPVGLLTLSALAACTDQLEAPTASLHTDPALEARAPLRDAEIDRTDTHFGARVVTTTERHDGAALRSAGEAMLTASEDEVYVEGGYGTDGRIRFTVYFESAAESPRIGYIRLVGNELQTFDRRGVRTRTERSDDAMARAGLPSGDHAMAYFSSTPPTCPPEAPECAVLGVSLEAESRSGDAGDSRTVRLRPSAGRAGRRAAGAVEEVEIAQRFHRVRRASPGTPEAWRVQEIRRTQRTQVNGREEQTVVVTTLRYRTWDRNEAKELSRAQVREQRPAVQPLPAPSAAVASVLSPPATENAQILGLLCAQGNASFDRIRPEVSRGYNVVYQHGFCSDASVFFRFDERLAQNLAIERSRAFSLASTDRIEAQAIDLRSRIASKITQRHLFIGHSQGGLVVRRLGQLSPEYVSGVVTIGTPHLGAHLASWGPAAAEEALERVIRRDCFNEVICGWVQDIVTDFTSGLLLFGRDDGAPAIQDLQPGSPFLRNLNTAHEAFPRVSIDVDAGRRWALARMVGDSRSSQDRLMRSARPGGDDRVMEVAQVYGIASFLHYFAATAIFTTFIHSRGVSCDRSGYSSMWPGCTDPMRDFSAQWNTYLYLYLTYEVTGRIMSIMDGIDRMWDELTTRREDETDGLIHLASQRYPNVPGVFSPQRVSVNRLVADSHVGQMKSPGVFGAMLESIGRIEGRSR